MRHDPKTALLRQVAFMRSWSDKELAAVAGGVDECEVAAGHVLTREGDVGRETFIVVEGWAAVYCDGEPVAAVGPGEFIGEMAMLDRGPRSATVIAKTAMHLLVIGPAAFKGIAARPDFGRALATGLAQRVRDLDAQR